MRTTDGGDAVREISVTRLESDKTRDVTGRELCKACVRTRIDDVRGRIARYAIGRRTQMVQQENAGL
jgi:hypothetical protein